MKVVVVIRDKLTWPSSKLLNFSTEFLKEHEADITPIGLRMNQKWYGIISAR